MREAPPSSKARTIATVTTRQVGRNAVANKQTTTPLVWIGQAAVFGAAEDWQGD